MNWRWQFDTIRIARPGRADLYPFGPDRQAGSADRKVDGLRPFAALVRLGLECHFLPILKTGQTRRLHGRNMDEHIFRAIVGRDETEAFGMIEEFDGAGLRHGKLPLIP